MMPVLPRMTLRLSLNGVQAKPTRGPRLLVSVLKSREDSNGDVGSASGQSYKS